MRRSAVCLGLGLSALFASGNLGAAETRGYELSVVVDGSPTLEYASRNRTYIEALRGRSYSLRIANPTSERVAVALSVDGRNVVDAKRTSARSAAKWVLWPGQVVEIPGWQVSGEAARRFFFTDTERSYAKWLGDTRNVGTIEAVFFREKRNPIALQSPSNHAEERESSKRADEGIASGESAGVEAGQSGGPAVDEPQAPHGGALRKSQPRRESDKFAATGAGERTDFNVQWIHFDEDPTPVARVALRYEYRRELVRLGVLPRRDDLAGRERGRGFEGAYAPDPWPQR